MQINLRTLSSLEIKPTFVSPSHINTPIIGMMTSFPTASDPMAPKGNFFHSPFLGICKRASEDPRQIKARGIEKFPMKLIASNTKERGGCPSGVLGIGVPGTGTNSTFSFGTRVIGKDMKIEREMGVRRSLRIFPNVPTRA